MILTIPRALPSWNMFYAGKHWSKRAGIARTWHHAVRLAAEKTDDLFCVPVDITITRYGARAIDPDNICAKLAIDGLVRAGVLVNDTPACVDSVTLKSRKSDRDEEWTVIEIEESK